MAGQFYAGAPPCDVCHGTGKVMKQVEQPCYANHDFGFCHDCKDTGVITVEVPDTCDNCGGIGMVR